MEYSIEKNVVLYGEPGAAPLALITFPETAPGVYCIDHTEVDPSLGGQGIGGQLVSRAVAEIRRRGGQVTATCSFARAWLERHPDAVK